jgi:predicted nucleic acid-binding protein
MSSVVVDSNVLLDAIVGEPAWADWSMYTLADLARGSRLVINPIIFAEVSIGFASIEDVEAALGLAYLAHEPISLDAAFLAGKAYLAYRKRGGARRSPLPDFFIGAHAAVSGYRLLTRDAARYRTYFPRVVLICPDAPI